MEPLLSKQIRGTWGAVLLPILHDDSINGSRLEDDEIFALVSSGIDGVYTNGTAGEFYAQSEDELERIHDRVAAACQKAQLPFQVGACHPCAQTSLERMKRARQWKPAAIQVILPDWFPLTDHEAACFLGKAAEATASIGLILYNPPHARRGRT